MPVPPFSEIARYRGEAPKMPTITAVMGLVGRHGKLSPVLMEHLETLASERTVRVLDIGAWDRALGRSLERSGLPHVYKSLDVDESACHDFRTLDEVTGNYDVVALFEVIEHLSYEEADEILHRIHALLAPGGRLFLSTPNPFHPRGYFADVSHKQHWPAGDLYALLRHVGFGKLMVEMYGVVYSEPSSLPRAIVSHARNLIWRAIGLDRRGGLLAIAIKDSSPA